MNKRDTIIIGTSGNYFEYNNATLNKYNSGGKLTGISNINIWEADNPILVTQYAYSQTWDKISGFDGNDKYDPFMLNLIKHTLL